MPPRTRNPKTWSKIIEQHGVTVRIYERAPGSMLYCSVVVDGGRKDRRSLGHRDRERAEDEARELCAEIARLRVDPSAHAREGLTLGRLAALYLHHAGPHLRPQRRRFVTTTLGMWRRHLGDDFPLEDFGQHTADTYFAARRSGELRPPTTLRPDGTPRRERSVAVPRAGTLRNELEALSRVCNWATEFFAGGRPLLQANPVRRVKRKPVEHNPRRPVATPERIQKLRDVADRVEPRGVFRALLAIAWGTGRRINAICHLRRSDLLFTPDALRAALAAAGQDERLAAWGAGIRWRAEWDKKGYETFSPMPAAVRAELEHYLRRNPVLGDGWLFTMARDPARPIDKQMAAYYLRRAEKLAGLVRAERGGWHSLRRGWAQLRKSLPAPDVALAGGWRDLGALQVAYQAADPETVRRVVDLEQTA